MEASCHLWCQATTNDRFNEPVTQRWQAAPLRRELTYCRKPASRGRSSQSVAVRSQHWLTAAERVRCCRPLEPFASLHAAWLPLLCFVSRRRNHRPTPRGRARSRWTFWRGFPTSLLRPASSPLRWPARLRRRCAKRPSATASRRRPRPGRCSPSSATTRGPRT